MPASRNRKARQGSRKSNHNRMSRSRGRLLRRSPHLSGERTCDDSCHLIEDVSARQAGHLWCHATDVRATIGAQCSTTGFYSSLFVKPDIQAVLTAGACPRYQRSPPPPRGGRGVRSRASLTRNGRPPISMPFRCCIAVSASALGMSTKPKPRGLPVSRSLISFTDSTVPCCSNMPRTSSSVAVKGKFPT
jgi:hypothetical protein